MVIDEFIIVEDGIDKSVESAEDGLIDVIAFDAGKNLLNRETISLISITDDNVQRYGWKYERLPQGTYTISVSGNYDNIKPISYKTIKDGVYSNYTPIQNTKTLTLDGTQDLVIYLYNGISELKEDEYVQLELGSTETDYEPFGGRDYNFAKEKDFKGLSKVTCPDSVPEPIIDMQIMGNSIQPKYTGKNLFNSTLWETATTLYGLTIQYLKDEDCFMLNGTTSGETTFALKYINIPVNENEIFSLSSTYVSGTITKPSGALAVAYFGKSDTPNQSANWQNVSLRQENTKRENITCDASYISAFWFFISAGVVFDNYKIKLQLEQNSVATDYERYVGGVSIVNPSPEFPLEIESVGEKTNNLLQVTTSLPYTSAGLTVSRNSDGSINVKGTAIGLASLYLSRNISFTLKAGTYTLNNTDVEGATVYLLPKYHWGTFTIKTDTTYTGAYIDIPQSLVGKYIDLNFYPQLNEGDKVKSYEPYGYKVPVIQNGKNLFNLNGEVLNTYGTNLTIQDNSIIATATNTGTYYNAKIRMNDIQAGTIVTVSGTWVASSTNVGRILFAYYDTSSLSVTTIGIVPSSNEKITVTIPEKTSETQVLCVIVYSNLNGTGVTGATITYTNIQVEIGSTQTDYESYFEPTTTNIYLNEPLRKIGGYADYIDYKNKKVVRQIDEYVMNGTETVRLGSTIQSDKKRLNISIIGVKATSNTAIEVYCSHYRAISPNETYTNKQGISGYDSVNYVTLYDENYQTVDGFTSFVLEQYNNNTPLVVNFILATPTEETIDIPEISTSRGTNIFEFATEVSPSFAKINYWRQMGTDVVSTEEIIEDGTGLLIIRTGASLTESGTGLIIGG